MGKLKDKRESILSSLKERMSKLSEEIKECEDDITATTEKKMTAQEQGDLSENVEYQTAVEKLGQLYVTLANLTNTRESWNKFQENKGRGATEYIGVGSCIVVQDMNFFSYTLLIVPQLLGAAEIGAITTKSPVGKAALGKVIGDLLEVQTPRGTEKYTITDIY